MNIYEFMSTNPCLTFFLVLIIIMGAGEIIVRVVSRISRQRNISKHGYPPTHCDADGDFRGVEKD